MKMLTKLAYFLLLLSALADAQDKVSKQISTGKENVILMNQHRSVAFTLSGVFNASLQVEGHKNKTATWTKLLTESAPGTWLVDAHDYVGIRVRCISYSSGTVMVTLKRSKVK